MLTEAVLDCWWMAGTLKCFVNPGYTYNMKVNTQLTLNISHVTSVNTGTYACQVVGYRPSSFGTCQFETEQSNLEKKIGCFMPPVQLGEEASFSCHFPEDLSVTKKDFSVYHYTEVADAVVDCSWISGKLKCLENPRYKYTKKDDTTLTVTINHLTESHAGVYVCQIAGYRQSSFGICPVKIYVTEKPDSHQIQTITGSETFWILYEFVILPVFFTIFLIYFIFWLKKKCQGRLGRRLKRKLRFRKRIPAEYEEALVFFDETGEQTNINDEVTEEFKEYLLYKVEDMYPKYLESFYFVPPVYFNKGRYQKQCLEGHDVYVPDPPDPSDVRHDQAMQRVLHCLRRMAEQHEEQMFVLTQFKYEDYLNSPIHRYERNHLPMPFALKVEEKSVGCFDILIVHRYQGVLVLVVKDVESEGGEQDEEVSAKLTEGLKQLKLANRMVKHLIQDLPNIPKIQQAVILPNCNSESLSQVLGRSTNLEQEIRECLELNDSDDPTELFLCSEHLSEPEKPWDVSLDVVHSIRNWWNKLIDAAHTDEDMTDYIYLTMITRFFGPETQSTLEDTNGYKQLVLPKTLEEAVSLTGDLYRRQVLYPDMIDLLQEPNVFLAGPRSTGKTTMLTIAGTKWLRSGKNVIILKESSPKSCSFLLHIQESLSRELATQLTSGRSHGQVIPVDCDFSSEEGIDNCIEEIISKTRDNKHLCVLIEVHPEGKMERFFCEQLYKKSQDICLWIVGHDANDCPAMGKSRSYTLTTALNCPPAVVREVGQKLSLEYSHKYEFPPPTDGPPVKHVYHNVEEHHQKSHCCWKCGNEVGRFFSEDFSEQESVSQEPKHPDKRNLMTDTIMRASYLRYKDILIVFECRFKDNDNFLKALRQSNIPVQTLRLEDNKNVSTDDEDTAYAMSVTDMEVYRPKRKIVVYVEMDEQLDSSEYKEIALTCCTSQLIWVHCK